MNAADLEFLPMNETDLAWVVENERELHAFPWSPGNFADCLKAGYSSWIMRRNGLPVGYAVMLTVVDEAHLLNISIARSAQREGAGRQLMQFLLALAHRLGASQFFLEVRPSNAAALALYERQGFSVIGRRKRYYPAPNGEREDAIVMRLDL
ncbi:MAG TPA: ribosomal protein S18-alanine N-acetyltransferase [Aromatoleum sp.]|uniref:ribosomal protein S18-alanine N-acetyltransferase n=1 Tax=Aromatoleum sp. TaxID=2307007 RepID=UPI002B46EA87|nr:ribosomal protein S18-alanine N-acetyltransferase [Aromatoleum sp.]HJV24753.1 ribosomal protein S18-alanine N-acetyltransferase [Aromatoleum sp.]